MTTAPTQDPIPDHFYKGIRTTRVGMVLNKLREVAQQSLASDDIIPQETMMARDIMVSLNIPFTVPKCEIEVYGLAYNGQNLIEERSEEAAIEEVKQFAAEYEANFE